MLSVAVGAAALIVRRSLSRMARCCAGADARYASTLVAGAVLAVFFFCSALALAIDLSGSLRVLVVSPPL
jgi:hypothetical protein